MRCAGVEDVPAHDLGLQVLEDRRDLLGVELRLRRRRAERCLDLGLDGVDRGVAVLLVGDLVGLAQIGSAISSTAVSSSAVSAGWKSRGSLAAFSASLMIASMTGWKCLWPNMTAPSMTSSASSLASDSTISTASSVPATTRSSFDSSHLVDLRVQHVLAVDDSRRGRRRSGP